MDVFPITLATATDELFSHNEIIALWVEESNEDGRYHQEFWRGEAWKLPEKFKYAYINKFFGTIPESMMEADTLNICVHREAPGFHYKPEYAEAFMRGEGHKDDNVHQVENASEAAPGYQPAEDSTWAPSV